MKLIDYYLRNFYILFIRKNSNQSWAITRSATLLLVCFFLLIGILIVLAFKIFPFFREDVKDLFEKRKLIVQVWVLGLGFLIHRLLLNRLNKIVNKNELISDAKDRVIVIVTLPVLVLVFIGLIILKV